LGRSAHLGDLGLDLLNVAAEELRDLLDRLTVIDAPLEVIEIKAGPGLSTVDIWHIGRDFLRIPNLQLI